MSRDSTAKCDERSAVSQFASDLIFTIPRDLRLPPNGNQYRSPHTSPIGSSVRKASVPIGDIDITARKPPKSANLGAHSRRTRSGTEGDARKIEEIIRRFQRNPSDAIYKTQDSQRTQKPEESSFIDALAAEQRYRRTEQLLGEKNREIEELRAKLAKNTAEKEIGRLNSIVHTLNRDLEKVAKERDELKQRLNDFEGLGKVIKELEDMQDSLIRENLKLKEELMIFHQPIVDIPAYQYTSAHIKAACRGIELVHFDLGRLSQLLLSLRGGTNADLSFLLSASSRDIAPSTDLLGIVERLKEELQRVKVLVGDCYAEQCGAKCAVQ